MTRFKLYAIGIIILGFSLPALTQNVPDTAQRWAFGFNMGYYQANRFQANFYNGSEQNANSINLVFGNQYRYQEIFNYLLASDTIIVAGLPGRMSYQPAICLGFSLRYQITSRLNWFIRFNIVKLHTSDYFTVNIDPNTFPSFPKIRPFDIYGVEERMLIDMGLTLYTQISRQTDWFIEGGFDLNNTNVKSNKIRFDNLEYSIVDIYGGTPYTPGLSLQEYPNEQGGIGYGVFGGGGVRIKINENYAFEPGLNIFAKKIVLPGYDAFRPHAFTYVRLTMKVGISK